MLSTNGEEEKGESILCLKTRDEASETGKKHGEKNQKTSPLECSPTVTNVNMRRT